MNISSLLHKSVVALVVSAVGLGLLNSGAIEGLVSNATAALAHLTDSLRALLLALSLPALLVGGVVAISPRHRQLGTELAIGGLIGLVVATLGPIAMHWLGGAMTTYSDSLLGSVR